MKVGKNFWAFAFAAILMAVMPIGSEPHLIGKIRWVLGGAVGMKGMDWFDLLLHGGPLLAFLVYLVIYLVRRKTKPEGTE